MLAYTYIDKGKYELWENLSLLYRISGTPS